MPDGSRWRCAACSRPFPVVAGIPDLRLELPSWIDIAEDRRRALALADAVGPIDAEGAVRFVFANRPGWDERVVERRVRQVLELPGRLREETEDWLAPLAGSGPVLDIGCGSGALLASLTPRGVRGLGVDVSLEWLVVADRMVRAAGGEPQLACALAEALPLRGASIGAAAALDVIEHVADPTTLVAEAGRVLRPGGALLVATPNRFSLGAEPHVGVWGVGWLPTRLQDRYVRWRSGKPYGFVRLLSRRELGRIVSRRSGFDVRITPAAIPDAELRAFSSRRRTLGAAYNRLSDTRVGARLVGPVSPFFHLEARRR
jgi:2-polyprenyl-3-methyl-5-hydroxy-6-metoxy-1,4-benzoquinol methylase